MPKFLQQLLRPLSTSSASMSLQPADILATKSFPGVANPQRAIFAAGCFWGVEKDFRKHFGNGKGMLDARVGYTGGKVTEGQKPSYEEVCSGRTGHAESLLVVFDPNTVTYRQLVEFFFKMHDPTTMNRQGADSGTQYRSAIFAEDDEQLMIAKDVKAKVQAQWYKGKSVVTEIAKTGPWFDAEDYHQDYLEAKPWGYQCPMHFVRNLPDLHD